MDPLTLSSSNLTSQRSASSSVIRDELDRFEHVPQNYNQELISHPTREPHSRMYSSNKGLSMTNTLPQKEDTAATMQRQLQELQNQLQQFEHKLNSNSSNTIFNNLQNNSSRFNIETTRVAEKKQPATQLNVESQQDFSIEPDGLLNFESVAKSKHSASHRYLSGINKPQNQQKLQMMYDYQQSHTDATQKQTTPKHQNLNDRLKSGKQKSKDKNSEIKALKKQLKEKDSIIQRQKEMLTGLASIKQELSSITQIKDQQALIIEDLKSAIKQLKSKNRSSQKSNEQEFKPHNIKIVVNQKKSCERRSVYSQVKQLNQ